MTILFQALLLVVLSIGFAVRVWRDQRQRRDWLIGQVALCVSFTLAALVIFRWDVLSVYLRPALALGLAGFVPFALRRLWRASATAPSSSRRPAQLVARLSFSVALLVVTGVALLGYHSAAVPVDLTFPLAYGTYFVIQGGSSRLINHHYVDATQRYALDIDAFGGMGGRATSFALADVAAYRIFRRPVLSPCEGRVRAVRDALPDQVPPDGTATHAAGNYIAIDCHGVTVVLAHLHAGSLAVKPGQAVLTGSHVAEVGNSGNSSEPHLHVHAARNAGPLGLGGIGVPIRFDGRFLVRNSLVSVGAGP